MRLTRSAARTGAAGGSPRSPAGLAAGPCASNRRSGSRRAGDQVLFWWPIGVQEGARAPIATAIRKVSGLTPSWAAAPHADQRHHRGGGGVVHQVGEHHGGDQDEGEADHRVAAGEGVEEQAGDGSTRRSMHRTGDRQQDGEEHDHQPVHRLRYPRVKRHRPQRHRGEARLRRRRPPRAAGRARRPRPRRSRSGWRRSPCRGRDAQSRARSASGRAAESRRRTRRACRGPCIVSGSSRQGAACRRAQALARAHVLQIARRHRRVEASSASAAESLPSERAGERGSGAHHPAPASASRSPPRSAAGGHICRPARVIASNWRRHGVAADP